MIRKLPKLERELTVQLRADVGELWPDAVTFKHSDSYTSGIPDWSVSLDGVTYWFETKLLRGETLTTAANKRKLQRHFLKKLDEARVPCGYVVGDVPDQTVNFFSPRELVHPLITYDVRAHKQFMYTVIQLFSLGHRE